MHIGKQSTSIVSYAVPPPPPHPLLTFPKLLGQMFFFLPCVYLFIFNQQVVMIDIDSIVKFGGNPIIYTSVGVLSMMYVGYVKMRWIYTCLLPCATHAEKNTSILTILF